MENVRVAILGGGDDELQILSEFHRTPGIEVIGIYDRDTRAVALEIAEKVLNEELNFEEYPRVLLLQCVRRRRQKQNMFYLICSYQHTH